MIQPSNNISDKLKDPMLLKRLMVYSHRKLQPMRHTPAASFMSAEDLVQEAISLTLGGERPWNEERCPELFAHLAGCVRSILSNQVNKKEFELRDDAADAEAIEIPDPAKMLVEIQELAHEWITLVEKHAPDLKPMVIAIIEKEITGRKELSLYLDIPVKDVDNWKARLKRLYQKHLKEG